MAETAHLFSAFQEHKDVFTGETYDYLFSYALHWDELRSLSTSFGEYAASMEDPRVRELVQQTQRCVRLLEKDFSALVRAITKKYVRKEKEAGAALSPPMPAPELKLDTMKRWNSIPASMDMRRHTTTFSRHTVPEELQRCAERQMSESFTTQDSPVSDLRVVAQIFTNSVELARMDDTCFMRDLSNSAREQDLADTWVREFPAQALCEPGNVKRMKPLIRRGIPHSLRRDVWAATTGALKLLGERPHLYTRAIQETFPQVTGVSDSTSANLVSKMQGVDPSKVPLFGGKLPFQYIPLNEHGIHQLKILLCVLAQNTHVEHCPMLAIVVAALLMYMPEAKAYAAAKCLLETPAVTMPGAVKEDEIKLTYRYIPTTAIQSKLATGIFAALLKKKLPTLARHLEKLEADVLTYARSWFDTLFCDVLPFNLLLDVLDSFFLEGSKVLQRVALALVKTAEKELLKATTKTDVDEVLQFKLTNIPELQNVMRTAFSFQLKRKEMEELERQLRGTVKVDADNASFRDGVYYRPAIQTKSKIILRDDHWETLFYWLADHPGVPSTAPWRLAFSTWRDGFSLKSLYGCCHNIGPNILLLKAIPHHDAGQAAFNWGMEILGVFSNEPPRLSKEYYGTGSCFVFRMTPRPQRWTWAWDAANRERLRAAQPEEADAGGADWQLRNDMFINGYDGRLLFGGGDKGPALELAGDLQTASTNESETYRNGPLCSAPLFDIQHLEVYAFTG